jgi:hypothetical protein
MARMNGMIASATGEPSRGTSTRLGWILGLGIAVFTLSVRRFSRVIR